MSLNCFNTFKGEGETMNIRKKFWNLKIVQQSNYLKNKVVKEHFRVEEQTGFKPYWF